MVNYVYPSYINYCLKRLNIIMVRCQLCSTCYTALWIKNSSKSTSVITMKILDNFCYKKEAIMCNRTIVAFCCQQRWMEHKSKTMVSPWQMHRTYFGMTRDTSYAEEMSNSKQLNLYPQSLLHITLVWRH